MPGTLTEQTTTTLNEKLTAYQELCARREDLAERIRLTESEKESVSQRIYEKVRAEYESELSSIASRLEPLKTSLQEMRRTAEDDVAELDEKIRSLEDLLAEANFRHRVGEYEDTQRSSVTRDVQPRLDDLHAKRAEWTMILSALDRRRQGREETPAPATTPSTAPATRTAMPAPAPAPAPISARAQHPAAGMTHTAETRATTNPAAIVDADDEAPKKKYAADEWLDETHLWADDEVADTEAPAADKTTPGKRSEDDDDPLAALADPSEEKRDVSRVSGGMPALTIRSGSSLGRVIPLLPMTMSLGREHDNNIEVKDPEVARYHARLVYENGAFSIEDLESSSGTFVNGEKTIVAPLSPGDVVRVGATELVFELS